MTKLCARGVSDERQGSRGGEYSKARKNRATCQPNTKLGDTAEFTRFDVHHLFIILATSCP